MGRAPPGCGGLGQRTARSVARGGSSPPPEAEAGWIDELDEDDISTILFPGVQPLAVPEVSSTTDTTEPRCARLQVVSDEGGLSSTRSGRALRWIDPEAPSTSTEAAERTASSLDLRRPAPSRPSRGMGGRAATLPGAGRRHVRPSGGDRQRPFCPPPRRLGRSPTHVASYHARTPGARPSGGLRAGPTGGRRPPTRKVCPTFGRCYVPSDVDTWGKDLHILPLA